MAVITRSRDNKGYKSDFLQGGGDNGNDPSSIVVLPLPSISSPENEEAVVVLERDTLSLDPKSGKKIYRHYHNYTIVMNQKHRCALFVALNINQALLEKTDKTVTGWRIDGDDYIGSENQLNDDYYKSNQWDKGHMAADASAGWGETLEARVAATNDTYYYTNATLQHENFNRDEWKDIEFWIREKKITFGDRINEITGTIFLPTSSAHTKPTFVKPEGRPEARVPEGFFKVISYLHPTSNKLQVECFVVYQDHETLEDRKGNDDINKKYQVKIDKIEELTGLKFDPIYHQANKNTLENNDEEQEGETPIPSSVKISAAMVDPKGKDSGNEWISLLVPPCQDDDNNPLMLLNGWKLQDQAGRSLVLSEDDDDDGKTTVETNSGGTTTITINAIKPIRLTNTGGSISLYNANEKLVHQVQYTKDQVQEGVAVTFHRED